MERLNLYYGWIFKSALSITVIVCLSCGLLSCGKEEQENQEQLETISTDYTAMLLGHWKCTYGEWEYATLSFGYQGNGTILYEYYFTTSNETETWEILNEGNYTLSGNRLTAKFTKVMVAYMGQDNIIREEGMSYNGFKTGQNKTIYYTIESCDGQKLILKDENGRISTYEKYADIR